MNNAFLSEYGRYAGEQVVEGNPVRSPLMYLQMLKEQGEKLNYWEALEFLSYFYPRSDADMYLAVITEVVE